MKPRTPRSFTANGLKMIEDGLLLLRNCPPGLLAAYYLGALPFVCGLLYFWTDMGRGAYADTRLAGSATGVACLYVWMKCCHAIFCRELLARVGDEPPQPWTAARLFRMAILQTTVQPWALILRPLALLITVPYGWVRAFFENVSILGDGSEPSIRAVCRRSLAQAALWPATNHQSLAFLFLFGIFVFLNLGIVIVMIPSLIKTFTGIESAFTKSEFGFLNTTFVASVLCGTYLCVNPLTKAVFVLRCFHGAALESGADLRVDLRRIRQTVAMAAVMLGLWLVPAQATAPTASATPADAPSVLAAEQLSERIDNVLQRREFTWREPRQMSADGQKGWFDRMLDDWQKTLREWVRPLKKNLRQLADWIEKWLRARDQDRDPGNGGMDWAQPAKWLVIALVVILLAFGIWLWRKARRRPEAKIAEPVAASMPDLESEDITAAELPEDGWLRLAQEMADQGETRLALRAFYLAGLSLLGSRQWVTLARHKSNRDYLVELGRRGRASTLVRENFAATLSTFERSWYGSHAVTHGTLDAVRAHLEAIRSC